MSTWLVPRARAGRANAEIPRRIAVLGAFPFPRPQGSQIFVRDQIAALERAGAEPTLFCYGRGDPTAEGRERIVRVPRALSPRPLRSGPSPGKPLADLALAVALVGAHRRQRFDVALAHNAEAAVSALAARRVTGVPVVYVAHTLMGQELGRFGPRRLRPLLDAAGRCIDRRIAAGADAVMALCDEATSVLAPAVRGPVACIPPGLDPAPPPSRARIAEACARHGLTPGRFALYSGNLDPYQDLDLLAEAARRIPEVPIAVATHAEGAAPPGVRTLRIGSVEEGRALLHGAGVCVLARSQPGGFPIKLLNYMEAERAIVARRSVAAGLVHDRTAWLVPDRAGADEFATAVRALLSDPSRRARLGAGARRHLEAAHSWPDLTRRTLRLAATAMRSTQVGTRFATRPASAER